MTNTARKTDCRSESRESRHNRLARRATEDFSNHGIVSSGSGRWLLCGKSSNLWTEIIVCHGGYLFANGDIEHVLWGVYGDKTEDPTATLRWIGSHPVVDSYVAGKAVIGTGAELATETDPLVYAHDLLELLKEYEDFETDNPFDTNMPEDDKAEKNNIKTALSELEAGEHPSDVSTLLYVAGMDAEILSKLGRVPAVRVYYAHAAVVRLCAALDAEEAVVSVEQARKTESAKQKLEALREKLTAAQRQELARLSKGRQATYGASRARVQNNLVVIGLARYLNDDGVAFSVGDLGLGRSQCEITEAGRRVLAEHKSRNHRG